MTKKDESKPEEPCCANCPAFSWTQVGDLELENLDPSQVSGECHLGPPVANPGKGSKWTRPAVKGTDKCFTHPGLVEEMSPGAWYGDDDEDEDDEDLEDDDGLDDEDEDLEDQLADDMRRAAGR